MQTTRWTDTETSLLEEAIERILKDKLDDGDGQNIQETCYINIRAIKSFENNQQMILNNRNITFNYITYSFDKINPGFQPIADRTTSNSGFVIVYHNGVNVSYIISRNSDALKILRKLTEYSKRREIVQSKFDINSDLFVWLISKVYNGDNIFVNENFDDRDITIDAIKGFKGNTDDLLTTVTAAGETVMNIISTLSFLLESKNLKQIKLDIEYRNHNNIELTLNNNSIISTDCRNYIGEYEVAGINDLCIAKLYLIIYLEILPLIIQTYQNELDNGEWNVQRNIDFLRDVAEELTEKVDLRLENLQGGI